ncbi:MAG: phosphoenolpyruvate--protein phosphotransferase [Verrucomicrobia bacterium]|nr:MAG: phosphoenolpyruvate--protein phosphotransferase [Verrucomicrobiota bacterium]
MNTRKNITFSGISISEGLAVGRAFVFQDIFERDLEAYTIEMEQVDGEYARLERAIEEVLADLSLSADRVEEDLESAIGNIFRAHGEMLRDVAFINEIRTEIERELVNSERALRCVFGRWERKFRSMDSDVFKLRGDDVADLARRLLRSLAGLHSHSLERMPSGSILVAQKLLPSDTTFFSQRSVAGIVVEHGGPGSHCALLTRQLGIPGVTQVPDLLDSIKTGDLLLLDGLRGAVTVAPDRAGQARFSARMKQYYAGSMDAKKHSHESAVTRDGVTIPVMANIGNRHDAETAVENGADGVGLFRIEVFFLSRKILPTEEELVTGISKAIIPMKGKPVTIRLLDIGGDKPLPYLPLPPEPDPFLGRRGVRFLLDYPELLDVQLRALLRISREHDIQIIVPMVTIVDDMKKVRAALDRVGLELGYNTLPPLGAMIETPAAALCADEIAAVSDTLNIGSNDLTQYTMAAGRENAFVYKYFMDDHPSVFKLLQHIGREAKQTPVGICGELAGQSNQVQALLRAGMRMLSVPPPLIPSVKEAVRQARAM